MAILSLAFQTQLLAVVPILPAIPALLVVLPTIAMSILIALAAMFRPATFIQVARLAWRQRWALLLIGGLVFGTGWLVAQVGSVSGTPSETSTGNRGNDWPMDRGGLQRRGATSGALAAKDPGIVWKYQRGEEAFYSSPAIVGNRVYIVGSHGDQGRIYCLDAVDGDVLWSVSPPGYRATFSSPVIARDRLVCGEGLHHAKQARVVCIDLRANHEGDILWMFTTRGHVECTPVIEDNQVFFGAGDDGVYCLDLKGSADGKPHVIWHAPASELTDAETSLAVFKEFVYVGLGVNGNSLAVLNRRTGRLVKRIAFPYPVFSPPATQNGKLYVGMGIGDYITPTEKPAGQVACIDLQTLKVDWTFKTQGTVLGAVVADEDGIVFGCADGSVVRLDFAGQPLARFDTHAAVLASPAIAENILYVVNDAGTLHALTSNKLTPLWEEQLGRHGRYISSPTVGHGHIYIGTELNGLLCVGQPAAAKSLGDWPGELGGAGAAGCLDGSKVPVSAKLRWQLPTKQPSNAIVTSPVAPAGNGLLVPYATGDLSGLVYLKENQPEKVQIEWKLSFADGLWSSPTVAKEMTFFVNGKRGEQKREIHGVSIRNPKDHWSRPIARDAAGVLLADEHSLIVQCDRSSTCAFDHDGTRLWQKTLGRIEQLASGNAAVVVAAVEEPQTLVLFDRPTGEQLWRVSLQARPTTAPVLLKDTIVIGTAVGMELHRVDDGSVITRNEDSGAGARGPVYADSTNCIFFTTDNQLITASISDLLTAGISDLSQYAPQSFLLTRTAGVIEYDGHLRRLHRVADSFVSVPMLEISALGRTTSPMVLQSGRLYVGIDGRGLVCIAEGSTE